MTGLDATAVKKVATTDQHSRADSLCFHQRQPDVIGYLRSRPNARRDTFGPGAA